MNSSNNFSFHIYLFNYFILWVSRVRSSAYHPVFFLFPFHPLFHSFAIFVFWCLWSLLNSSHVSWYTLIFWYHTYLIILRISSSSPESVSLDMLHSILCIWKVGQSLSRWSTVSLAPQSPHSGDRFRSTRNPWVSRV
jgi:hypothetical protein